MRYRLLLKGICRHTERVANIDTDQHHITIVSQKTSMKQMVYAPARKLVHVGLRTRGAVVSKTMSPCCRAAEVECRNMEREKKVILKRNSADRIYLHWYISTHHSGKTVVVINFFYIRLMLVLSY